jgi:hypothetical protein
MTPDGKLSAKLTFQRNGAAAAAILMILASLGSALPGTVRRNRELKSANAELVALQGTIVRVQREIRDTQAAIIRAQGEISALQQHK